jgi:enterochelin esterase-like enzyme
VTGAGRFPTIELSDPDYEHDGLRHVTVRSPALGGRGDVTVWAPDGGGGVGAPLPIVVLLHGVYGSHWAWAYKAGAHRTAARLVAEGRIPPMALAMPSDGLWGDGSGYVPLAGRDAEAWILDDVVEATELAVPSARASAGVCIAGLSMGGFGALRLGGRHPDRFRAIAGLSSITRFSEMDLFTQTPLDHYGVEAASWSVGTDLVANRSVLPPLLLVCGTDDPLIDGNRRLHEHLVDADVHHRYEEHPGGHEWRFWADHLGATLEFFGASLTASA